MAQFIPRRDETLEADKHQKWLEGKAVAHDREIAALRAELDKLLRANATSGKQVAVINSRDSSSGASGGGLPPGGTTGMVLRKKSGTTGTAAWTTQWQGLMPEYWVSLDGAGASYYVSGMSLLEYESDDADLSRTMLPAVQFSDDGLTMYPIDYNNFQDAIGSGAFAGAGHSPFHLYVDVNPSFEGEEFTIYLPSPDNLYGTVTPFYRFNLANIGDYNATVYIEGTRLFYAGTDIPVNGTTGGWDCAPSYGAAWAVSNVRGWGTAVTPVTSLSEVSDVWYEANVLRMRRLFNIRKDGALSVAALPGRVYNDTAAPMVIGKITAPVGTAPSGVAATFVVKKNGTSISSSFSVAAGANTGAAVLTDTAFAVGDYLTVECTQTGSAADVNIHIYAG